MHKDVSEISTTFREYQGTFTEYQEAFMEIPRLVKLREAFEAFVEYQAASGI